MQSRVECRAESEKTTAEQRREQISDESSAEPRAALKGEQNRGAEVQRRKGEKQQSFVQREERETLAGTLVRSVPI